LSREKKNKFTERKIKMTDLNTLPAEEQKAIEARRAYQRQWRAANKDKVREHNRRFWLKKAAEQQEGRQNNEA
jgi:hypothetical protein